ncbi:cupin domain-containing protein [Caballeronia sp. LZ062]|uniref:cupin domain-containing protein n=1 Tax=unclassified Caballeronia TaxID=2646786 RepID=UPI00285A0920|nr:MULTISPECIES: cupin domain-containing protein [unclassified Caballeronia]MDR5854852.1 cupin domain-containing protein [Caballeronia sp. LZ050]MDR5870619.1 cupin domain-containing protein [Caballeronia sp. LZ062]
MRQRPSDVPASPLHSLSEPSGAPLPDEVTPLLGNRTPRQFMRRYWQKKPLLIRQAIPGIAAPVPRDELFELADLDDVEARLITHFRNAWNLEHGPFAPDELPSVRKREWTLLVQGLNLHDERAHALMNRFRFIPDARLDDLMISYATDGGGVGPHFDSYDVFLLQVHGKRRWRIGAQRDLSLKPGLPLKVLQHFEPQEEWVLEPGDMLYLPPHIAHDGIAEGECMTCSIGFRAPSARELTAQFLYHLAERAGDEPADGKRDIRYRDPAQPPVATPGELPALLVERVGAILAKITWNEKDVAEFLGSYLSEPKANVVFDSPARALNQQKFVERAKKTGITLDRKTNLLYNTHSYFVNGEAAALTAKAKKWLPELADTRRLEAKRFVTLTDDSAMTSLLHEWYRAGWIQTDPPA